MGHSLFHMSTGAAASSPLHGQRMQVMHEKSMNAWLWWAPTLCCATAQWKQGSTKTQNITNESRMLVTHELVRARLGTVRVSKQCPHQFPKLSFGLLSNMTTRSERHKQTCSKDVRLPFSGHIMVVHSNSKVVVLTTNKTSVFLASARSGHLVAVVIWKRLWRTGGCGNSLFGCTMVEFVENASKLKSLNWMSATQVELNLKLFKTVEKGWIWFVANSVNGMHVLYLWCF